jgi:hypothetical protein
LFGAFFLGYLLDWFGGGGIGGGGMFVYIREGAGGEEEGEAGEG